MVTHASIAVTPVPNAASVPAPVPNVPTAVTPVPNAASIPAPVPIVVTPVPNATSAGNSTWHSALCDVTHTVDSQSASAGDVSWRCCKANI